MSNATLSSLVGTKWAGRAELWLDPLGNQADLSDCTIEIADGVVRYTWSYDGKPHQGSYTLVDGGADWTDTWHQTSVMKCRTIPEAWGLFAVAGTYAAPSGPDWGWRSVLSLRDGGELVLQMTNVTPWGEDGRAVRMICTKTG
jgi:hypothetical protein